MLESIPPSYKIPMAHLHGELMGISAPKLSLASFIYPAFAEDLTALQIIDLIVRDEYLSFHVCWEDG